MENVRAGMPGSCPPSWGQAVEVFLIKTVLFVALAYLNHSFLGFSKVNRHSASDLQPSHCQLIL